MKKTLLSVVLALVLVMTALVGCGKKADAPAGGAAASAGKVYLITMDRMDQHWLAVDQGAKDMATALGLEYKFDAPEKKENPKQIEALNNAVADGAKVILLAANDPSAISDAIKAAKDKGVKIIYVDSPANEPALATLSTDNKGAGKTAARTMLDELDAAGVSSGKIGIIGVNEATNSTMNREAGFKEVIAEDGRFTLLNTEYKDGEATASQASAEGFIAANSDLVGLYGTNEGSTVGVGNAIKASGKPIIGIGFDKSDAIQGLLNDGSLKGAMAQNPYTMGSLGMAQAFNAIKGYSTGPSDIDTGVAVLRKN